MTDTEIENNVVTLKNKDTEDFLIKQTTDTSVYICVTGVDGKPIQMLKISPDGFFVRDSEESVAPENEAREVYEAFKLFLALGDTTKPSFRAEYLACLKSRDEQYLKHDAAEQEWIKERADLKSRIAVLEEKRAQVLKRAHDEIDAYHGLSVVDEVDKVAFHIAKRIVKELT